MNRHRHDLADQQGERLQPLLSPHKPKTGLPPVDHRHIFNSILWLLRTGASRRDIPERYGPRQTVARRLYLWRKAGIWERLFAAVQSQGDAPASSPGTSPSSIALSWDASTCPRVTKGAQTPKHEGVVKEALAPKSTFLRRGCLLDT